MSAARSSTARRSISLALAAIGFLAVAAWAEEPAASAKPVAPGLEAAAFMAGHWVGEAGGGLSEEVWTAPAGDAMVGMWRLVHGGETQLFELLTVSEDPELGLVMRLRHFDPQLVGWEEKDEPLVFPLLAAADGEVIFEGEGRDGSTRLTYRRDGADGLVAVLQKAEKRSEFRYRRKGSEEGK